MKAVRLVARGASGVECVEIPSPSTSAGTSRVRMLAASLNRVDLYMRDSGAGITHALPQTMGVDGVGEILETAPGSGFAAGDRVILYPYEFCGRCRYCRAGNQPLCTSARIFGEHRDGTFAEEIVVPDSALVRLSRDVDIHGAAALGVAYLTAWRMVFGPAPAGPGQVVLVQGAGGGVSYAAMQLARMSGARVVVTTTGKAKLDHFHEAGVETIDYARDDVAARAAAMTGGEGFDLVIDNIGQATWAASLRALRRGGHLVTCGATSGANPPAELQRMFIRQLSVHGTTMGSLEEFRRLIRTFENGAFAPHIDSVFGLQDVAGAFARLGHPQRLGKVIIDCRTAR